MNTKEEIFEKVWNDNFVTRVLHKQFKNPNPEQIAQQNGMELEDVINSCWLVIWQRLDNFKPGMVKPETYLYRVVVNQMKTIMHSHYLFRYPCHDRLKHKKETRLLSLDYEYNEDGYTLTHTLEASGNMEVSLGLKMAMEQLDDRERYVVAEHSYKGRSSKEVGEDLNISGSMVRVIRDEAFEKLKEELV